MAYNSAKPVTGGSLVAADIRENFRALKEDNIVEGVAALGISNGMLAEGVITLSKLTALTAGDTLINAADDELSYVGTTYQKITSVFSLFATGTLRIKFDMKPFATWTAYGRIYRNGVAVGTEQSRSVPPYQTFSEDISGWSIGDLIEIYVKGHSSEATYIRNFRVYAVSACLGVVRIS